MGERRQHRLAVLADAEAPDRVTVEPELQERRGAALALPEVRTSLDYAEQQLVIARVRVAAASRPADRAVHRGRDALRLRVVLRPVVVQEELNGAEEIRLMVTETEEKDDKNRKKK